MQAIDVVFKFTKYFSSYISRSSSQQLSSNQLSTEHTLYISPFILWAIFFHCNIPFSSLTRGTVVLQILPPS